MRTGSSIYFLAARTIGAIGTMAPLVAKIAAMGFDTIAIDDSDPQAHRPLLALLLAEIRRLGLRAVVRLDPAVFDWHDPESTMLESYRGLGFQGFIAGDASVLPAAVWRALIVQGRKVAAEDLFYVETQGIDPAALMALAECGFDYQIDSIAPQLKIAPVIGRPEVAPWLAEATGNGGVDQAVIERCYRNLYLRTLTLSSGILMPAGFENGMACEAETAVSGQSWRFDLSGFISAANALHLTVPSLDQDGPLRCLSVVGAAVTAISRGTAADDDATLILINTDDRQSQPIEVDGLLGDIVKVPVDWTEVTPDADQSLLMPSPLILGPGDVRILHARYRDRLVVAGRDLPPPGILPPCVVIGRVGPEIDGDRFPVKRIVGDDLEVRADIFRDGHDRIAATLWVQSQGADEWTTIAMRPVDNDRWVARTRLSQIGRLRFAVEAWTDRFASWRSETTKKREAGQTITIALSEGRSLLMAAVGRAVDRDQERLLAIRDRYDALLDDSARGDLLLSNRVACALAVVPDQTDRVFQDQVLEVVVERETARFAAWYEMFPRSQGAVPQQSAHFDDCIRRLPEIRDMGFDVLYLAPIHPIGTINRKGHDNSVKAGPGDPGSPYAIGSEAGGHIAINAELGTIDDFRRLLFAARQHGLELAMDLAIQCAPDHPWLKEHPQWFRRQPDGSIKFAENPPKKYEDIVNLDFEQADWRNLWQAIKEVVLFWIGEGVKIFRVDNPHTKPVVFWQWLIAEIQNIDPAVLFLAEAFTRPKMMNQLSKVGFSQSYTYFTWRNTKAELIEYITELTKNGHGEYFRPMFFTNTPDILPSFLQTGGRAAFRIRLVLAATLSPAYGIYNGFELCEAEAVPGAEEYAHSEKYQYKVWDWNRLGHIKADIARINWLRHESPVLRQLDNLCFHEATHDDVLFYSKIAADRSEAILVAITLAPRPVVRTEIVFPLAAMGLSDDVEFETTELFTEERRRWRNARHSILIDPEVNPAMVLRFQQRPMASDRPVGLGP